MQDGIMVVYGGYDGKETFGDVWKLQTSDWTWQQMATSGQCLEEHVGASRLASVAEFSSIA